MPLLLYVSRVRAEDNAAKAAVAQQLFDEALKLMDAARYSEACPKLARSQELAPSGGTLLNLGDCYEKNGQTASAWVSFRDAAARAANAGQKQAQAAALVRADQLVAKLVRVKLTLAADSRKPGMVIKRDGESVSQAELGLDVPVDPGLHKLEASAPGFVTWSKSVPVADGGAPMTIVIPPLEALPAAPEVAPVAQDAGRTQRTIGLVVGGAGLLAAGIGGVFGLSASSSNDEAMKHCHDAAGTTRCDPTGLSLTDTARSQAAISTVLVTVGTAALATGLVLFIIAPRAKSGVATFRAIPLASRTSGGMTLDATW